MKKRETVNLAEDTAIRIAQSKARASEERVRESEQKFKALFDNAKDAIFIHDLEGRFLDVNREACERLGYSRDEILQMGVRDIDIPEFAAMVPARIEEVLRKGHVLFESEHRRRDGSRVLVEINSSLLEVGGNTLVFSTCRDITARKQAAQALRESEERYRRLFERMHDGFAHCRMLYENDSPQDFIYLDVNDAFERLTGLKNVVGKKISEVIPGIQESNPELFQVYGRVALTGQPERFESYLESLGIWFSISVYSPRKEHFVAVFENITERKRAEANRLLFTDTLQILNRSGDLHSLVRDVLGLIRERARFDAVGLRLRQGEDCPYYHHEGFCEDFLREENFLCAKHGNGAILHDAEGCAVLECTCGLVLSGRTDPCMSCFTKGGSFWTNVSTELLSLPREDDPRTNPRNNCIHRGYQSVGLFPVRAGQEIIGLLQLNDRREGLFTPETIAFYEGLAQNIGLALQRTVAEESLHESEERFRTAFERGAIAMSLTSLDTKLLKVNSAFCRMLGFSEAELVGRSFTQITPPEDVAANLAGLQQIISGEMPSFRMEKRYICKDGGIIWADMSTAAVHDPQGRPAYLVTHIQDITERKRGEEALRVSEERLRLAQQAARVGTFEWNLQTDRDVWTPELEAIYGLRPGEFAKTGEAWQQFLHPEDRANVMQLCQQSIQTGELTTGEWRVVWPDRSVHWVAGRWQVFKDASGQPLRMIGVNLDITARKKTEEALASAKEQLRQHAENLEKTVHERTADLEQSYRALQRENAERKQAEQALQKMIGELEHFSYTITHDMRAPLRAMQGFGSMLLEECAECLHPQRREFIRRITDSAGRMDSLITDALNYSKVVQQELELEPVDATKLLHGMVESYPEFQLPKAEVTIEDNIPVVMGNEAGLTQCFSNLLGNAVKFVEPDKVPKVRVWAERKSEYVRLWFEDNGIGIAKEHQDLIFTMFQQLDKAYEGTGIGLALVHKVVERMKGKAGVESEEGKGSRFWIELKPCE